MIIARLQLSGNVSSIRHMQDMIPVVVKSIPSTPVLELGSQIGLHLVRRACDVLPSKRRWSRVVILRQLRLILPRPSHKLPLQSLCIVLDSHHVSH